MSQEEPVLLVVRLVGKQCQVDLQGTQDLLLGVEMAVSAQTAMLEKIRALAAPVEQRAPHLYLPDRLARAGRG